MNKYLRFISKFEIIFFHRIPSRAKPYRKCYLIINDEHIKLHPKFRKHHLMYPISIFISYLRLFLNVAALSFCERRDETLKCSSLISYITYVSTYTILIINRMIIKMNQTTSFEAFMCNEILYFNLLL